ncbi:MAG: FHA domain-containing protein [Actinomycetota bacterium]|nr:FHA domain-containing protein [Actinomycetota bacterium]
MVVTGGKDAGAHHGLAGAVNRIGRRPGSEILLDDVSVSRSHAVVVRNGRRVLLRDTGSLNGTFVNRKRVDESVLEPGDEIQVGTYKLVYSPSPAS